MVRSTLIAYDGSASAKQAITAAAALMPGRSALIVTVWESLRDVAAATRIALPDDVVVQGIAAIDLEARDKALEIAAEGERLALTAGLHAETVAAERHGGVAATLLAEADAHVMPTDSREPSPGPAMRCTSIVLAALRAA